MKVIDNFLDKKNFNAIKDIMMSPNFPWFYQKSSSYSWDGVSQLTHVFYTIDDGNKTRVNTDRMDIIDPILRKLHAVGLVRVKANLTFPCVKEEETHTDYTYKHASTAVFYLNTNDGGTKVGKKIIKSKANRMLIMPANTPHSVVRHTDPRQGRFVINFNFFDGK